MTATVAPPAAASVCDGQGVEKRARRFSSACSCVGIAPVTTTTSVAAVSSTSAAAGSVPIALGQVATGQNAVLCIPSDSFAYAYNADAGFDFIQPDRVTIGTSYTVPQAGNIVSATFFDGYSGGKQAFQVWRQTNLYRYTLIGVSETLDSNGSGQVRSFVLAQPIPVLAGD
ncbi:hypothetical protein BCR37DRAFT_392233 [Protomyces lactucae-debilis]|uniref:Uncharacterized protein n=1 Tax=Protomyces lactucae-debilis TaxID=2754530 RepID=A0A1Y2FK77_PROLT|nr:uncharacterized protein BCR37DRAFT_392233 [Protomyces lactucae-debilis]ORY83774.1 hypothetical protein BCR37DRAFT_392233 [Protomyces lactucae-debilis]